MAAARESHSGSVTNSNDTYQSSEDQSNSSTSQTHPNVPLRLSHRVTASHVAGSSDELNRPSFSHPHQQQQFRNWISPSHRRQQSRSRESHIPRRMSVSQNRNAPYFANFRHLDRTFTDLNVAQTSVRRTNSDSDLGRSFEVVANNTEDNVNSEYSLANLMRQVSPETHEAFIRRGLSRLSRNMPQSSNGELSDLTSLRRDIALRLLSSVTATRAQEQSNNNNNNVNNTSNNSNNEERA